MDRALREFRIRGVATNLQFLENVINHPLFKSGECTTRFIDNTPELFDFAKRRDRATRLLRFLGDVVVNGNPEMKGREPPALPIAAADRCRRATSTGADPARHARPAARAGAGGLRAMDAGASSACCSPTPRCATRTSRCSPPACAPPTCWRSRPTTRAMLPQLFSLECWGGATFDVAMRFLKEDPWERLAQLRERVPNILFQMLLRGSNAVGYTNYPDNVVRYFVQQAAAGGVDLFRVFDSLNWVREHARGDRRGARDRRAVRRRDLLHRRPVRRGPAEVRPASTTSSHRQANWRRPACTSSASRTWPACASRAPRRRWSRR